MRPTRWLHNLTLLCSGLVMLQLGGCTTTEVFEFLQTVFLGVTAAGTYVIFRNV